MEANKKIKIQIILKRGRGIRGNPEEKKRNRIERKHVREMFFFFEETKRNGWMETLYMKRNEQGKGKNTGLREKASCDPYEDMFCFVLFVMFVVVFCLQVRR